MLRLECSIFKTGFDIYRYIAFTLLERNFISIGYLITNPARHVFCCRIEVQYFIDIAVVKFVLHALFDVSEIDYHAIFVQLFCTAIDSDNAVVTMRSRAFALIIQFELVRVGDFDAFGDVIHGQQGMRIGQPSAKILILCDMNKREWDALCGFSFV